MLAGRIRGEQKGNEGGERKQKISLIEDRNLIAQGMVFPNEEHSP